MHPSLAHLKHRPWPLPRAAWIWRQAWLNLTFIHYRVNEADLALPAGLKLQQFDGSAWVGVVPFRMANVMVRSLPALPGFSSFPELNVRTYVERDGMPGVWFFSLDADSWPLVCGARALAGLPYFKADMTTAREAGGTRFISRRTSRCPSASGEVRFEARYAAAGPEILQAVPGTFEHFIAERYCLYSVRRQKLLRLQVHHRPWPLQQADVEIHRNDLLRASGIAPADTPPICHYSPGVETITFPAEPLD